MMIDANVTTDARGAASYRCIDFDQNRVRWDQWLKDATNAGASQISAHLHSFRAYRADVSLQVIVDEAGELLAGTGIVSWKVPGVGARFGVGIGSPVGDVKYWPQLLCGLSDWCRQQKWMCVELSPHVAGGNEQARCALSEAGFRPAPIFAPVSGLGADLRVPLRDRTEEELLRSFRRQTRQHVTRSLTEGYQLSLPTSDEEVRVGVDFLHATSVENGIPFGPRGRFMSAVLDLVKSNTGYLALAKHGDRPLAGGVFVRVGQAHSCYRLATKRDDTHRRAAYFLHWMAMLRAHQERADWYYLTGRSTSSVYQFKRGFRPEEIELLKPHRLVLRPGLMRGIETVQPIAMQTARKVLGIANRLRGRS